MSIITSEFNYQRNSHRVDLPMLVEIDGVAYRTHDWSMGGVGLAAFDRMLEGDQMLDARCVLPMKESSISLRVRLRYKGTHGNVTGFAFENLSDRNKRVLRHYIELAIEGRLDNLEDLVSIVTTPAINSPIEEALTLSDIETDTLAHQFRSRSYLAISAGVIFVLLVAATMFYNTVYRVQATGLITGNIARVTANANGVIRAVYVEPDAYVAAGRRLFTVENPQQQQNLSVLRIQRQEKESQLRNFVEMVKRDPGREFLESLKIQLNQRSGEYKQAKKLFEQRIISFKDLKYLENQLGQTRTTYNREVKLANAQRVLMQDRMDELNLEIKGLREQAAVLQAAGASLTIQARHKGRIFHIEHLTGAYVTPRDVVLLLEKDVQPDVLIKLRNDEALKIRLGMPAEIHVPVDDRKYAAKVSAIGYTAVNGDTTDSMEASLNETLIKLEFDNKDLRLPANSRVKVWIRTF